MKIFRKQQQAETQDTITGRMAVYLERRQRKIANWMNRKTANLSRQDLFFALIIFCSAFGGYLLWLLLDTLNIFN